MRKLKFKDKKLEGEAHNKRGVVLKAAWILWRKKGRKDEQLLAMNVSRNEEDAERVNRKYQGCIGGGIKFIIRMGTAGIKTRCDL